MLRLGCSFFRQAADNDPRPWEGTWQQLRDFLERTHLPRPGLAKDAAKKSLPAISGTRFKAGTRRACENALEIGLLFLDFDNAREEVTGDYWPDPRTGQPSLRPKVHKVMVDQPVQLESVMEALWDADVDSYAWTTWSHRTDWPKFRVAIPLAASIPAGRWAAATEWALARLGMIPFRHGIDLPVLRDAARLNFLPGAPDPGSILRAETVGEHLLIPLDDLPLIQPPPPPTPSWQAAIVSGRHAAREAGDHWFAKYRVAGQPVDFMALDLPSLLRSHGIKVGRAQVHGNGQKWRCHCPLSQEHTGGIDDDCAVVIQTPGQWPSFKCAHSHHAHLALQDLIELFWGRP